MQIDVMQSVLFCELIDSIGDLTSFRLLWPFKDLLAVRSELEPSYLCHHGKIMGFSTYNGKTQLRACRSC